MYKQNIKMQNFSHSTTSLGSKHKLYIDRIFVFKNILHITLGFYQQTKKVIKYT